jgi:hypothetical protein
LAILPLRLYWNSAREDNFTTATPEGRRDAEAPGSGYQFVRIEGYISSEPSNVPGRPGTLPLNLFYNPWRGDNFTTATPEGIRSA